MDLNELCELNSAMLEDVQVAPGLINLFEWAREQTRNQQELEIVHSAVKGLRLRRQAENEAEDIQAAFARTGEKILRYAITSKIQWHRDHYYDYVSVGKSRRHALPPTCDQIAMGIY